MRNTPFVRLVFLASAIAATPCAAQDRTVALLQRMDAARVDQIRDFTPQ